MTQEKEREDVGNLATLLFFGFVCIIGYILEAYWNGMFPFYISFTNTVVLASPHGLLALCSIAVALLVLGALKAKYPRSIVAIFLVGGCTALLLLWLAVF
ncbi:MAG: hypothetical protein KIH01_02225 [Candidatus Freyarchaeota archaeon]|nr:hypothetical protein [Candidatus Jordarchaeia archaeon]